MHYISSLFFILSIGFSAQAESSNSNNIEVEKKIAELLASNNIRDSSELHQDAIEAANLAESINNKYLLLKAKYQQFYASDSKDENQSNEYSEVVTLAKELKDYKTLFNAMSVKANNHWLNQEYEAQITTQKEGYKLAQELEYPYGVAIILTNLGTTYRKLSQNEKALKYFNEALEFVKKAMKSENDVERAGPKDLYFFLQKMIAACAYDTGDIVLAEQINNELLRSYPDSFIINSDYIVNLIRRKKLDEAKLKLSEVEKKIEAGLINSKYAVANTYLLNAKLNYELEQYNKANIEFEKYFAVEGIFRDSDDDLKDRLIYANSLFKANQKEKAAGIFELYIQDLDKLHKRQIDAQVTYLQAAFNIERKEQEVEEAKALSNYLANQLVLEKNQKFWQTLSFVIIGLAIASLLVFYYVKSRQLNTVAHTDELTGVPNRRFIMEQLDNVISRSIKAKSEFSVAIFDIDHFKQVNDNNGHDVGDEVLKKIAELAQKALRISDLFGRVGGEEFMVVLSRIEEEQAFKILNRMREDISNYSFEHLGISAPVTISLGVSQFTGTETKSELLKKADIALYKAKDSGRNKIIQFDLKLRAV